MNRKLIAALIIFAGAVIVGGFTLRKVWIEPSIAAVDTIPETAMALREALAKKEENERLGIGVWDTLRITSEDVLIIPKLTYKSTSNYFDYHKPWHIGLITNEGDIFFIVDESGNPSELHEFVEYLVDQNSDQGLDSFIEQVGVYSHSGNFHFFQYE